VRKNKNILIIGGSLLMVVLLFVFGKKIYLSAKQESFISELNPQEQKRFRKLIDKIQKQTGWTMTITSGYRDFAKQEYLKRVNSKNANAGYSEHNYGIALDMVAEKDGQKLRKSSSIRNWEQTGIPQIAKQMGFRWGGDFTNYHDPVHFGLGHIYDTSELLNKAYNKFGRNSNNIRGNEINLT